MQSGKRKGLRETQRIDQRIREQFCYRMLKSSSRVLATEIHVLPLFLSFLRPPRVAVSVQTTMQAFKYQIEVE